MIVVLVTSCSSTPGGGGGSARATTTGAPTSTVTTVTTVTTAAPAPGPSLTVTTIGALGSPTTAPATTVTPGGIPADMLNPAVTQATIMTTICVSGYTRTIRPPVSITEPIKVHQIASYGYADMRVSDYEEDHVIALEIGGALATAANLFPEPHTFSAGDDSLENALHGQVCQGQLSLAGAQLRLFTAKVAHGYSRVASTA